MLFPSPMPRGDTEIRAGSPLAHVRSRAPQPLTQGPCRLDPRAQPRAEVETAGRTVREPREDTRELRARKGPFAPGKDPSLGRTGGRQGCAALEQAGGLRPDAPSPSEAPSRPRPASERGELGGPTGGRGAARPSPRKTWLCSPPQGPGALQDGPKGHGARTTVSF